MPLPAAFEKWQMEGVAKSVRMGQLAGLEDRGGVIIPLADTVGGIEAHVTIGSNHWLGG